MPGLYNSSSPGIFRDKTRQLTVEHNHPREIDCSYDHTYKHDKKSTRDFVDENIVSLKSCMAFFNSLKNDKKTDPETRAAATAAYVEDKANLENVKKRRP